MITPAQKAGVLPRAIHNPGCMEAHDETLAWVVMTRAPGLSTSVLNAALQSADSAAALLRLPEAQLALAGLGARTRAFLKSREARVTPAERRWLGAARHRLLTFRDPDFPPLLKTAAGCPIGVYVAGDAACLCAPQLAIIGSRNPTRQGCEDAFGFAHSLSLRGMTITSGMADGIDAAAHRGALAAGGSTIAVLGTGVDRVYPRNSLALAQQIESAGALVSEFPLGTPARRANFPRRNRLIAALSLGALVVEAAHRSGSLLTARLASRAGRAVFALPGSIHSPLSRGCHELIRRGAHLTENPDDILKELNFSSALARQGRPFEAQESPAESKPPMDKGQKILLDALGFGPADLDVLVLRTGFKPEAVSSMMLVLELEGHVRSAHGGRYTRVARSP
jgi:DNA processing protein